MNALDRLDAAIGRHWLLAVLSSTILAYPLFLLGCHIGDTAFSIAFGR